MDVSWQWGNRSNPADAQDGPQTYDNHLYYSFGVSRLTLVFSGRIAEFRDYRVSPITTQTPT